MIPRLLTESDPPGQHISHLTASHRPRAGARGVPEGVHMRGPPARAAPWICSAHPNNS
ncbi:hypothetical protein BC826DRAFT_1027984 [Russula brevipes]|nr:hypothetical protein BC826DRAFT_1027984 [Russula brevipes]